MSTRLLICTPVHNGVCNTNYMTSMVRLMAFTCKVRPDVEISILRVIMGANLSLARSAAATVLLDDRSLTHLLFVDADTGFRPTAVTRMVDADKPFVGCISPSRYFDKEKFFQAARRASTAQEAWAQGMDFVLMHELLRTPTADGPALVVTDGFAPMRQLGTGLTLLKREVIETMAERFPELFAPARPVERDMGCTDRIFQCFEALQDADGHYLSEDLSFCRRWTQGCGGEVWGCVDEPLSHAGQLEFEGRALDRLRPPRPA